MGTLAHNLIHPHTRMTPTFANTAQDPGIDRTPTPRPSAVVTPALAPEETDRERRETALAEISDDPAIQGFYDRVVPRGITPAAWIPFWPSAWPGLPRQQ